MKYKIYSAALLLTLMLTVLMAGAAGAKTPVHIEGIDSFYANPALREVRKAFDLNTWGSGRIRNNGINSKYFNKYLEEEDKDEILSNIDSDGPVIMADGFQGGELILGNFKIYAGLNENGVAGVSKDIMKVVLKGTEVGSEYKFAGTKGGFAVYGNIGAGYSRSFDKLADQFGAEDVKLGAAFHYLYGGMAKMSGDGSISLNYEDIITGDGKIRAEYAEKGTGYAADFGMTARMNERLTWSVSLLNLGSIKGKDARYYEYEYDANEEDFKETEDEPLDELVYKLPRKFNLGARYSWGKNTDVYGGYTLASYDSGYTDHRLTGGLEYSRIKFLPLRTGVTYSTLQNDLVLSAGAGLRLGFLHMNLGFSDIRALFGGAKSISFGLNTDIKF